jgi:O-antigen/teichoic acid export membrane protein
MGLGTLVLGASGYAFVAVAGHSLPAVEAAAVASFYLLANIVGPGTFTAVEQQASHATSRALARGEGPGRAVRRVAREGVVLTLVVVGALALVSPVLVERSLKGSWSLFAAVLVGVVTSSAIYVARGVLGGMRRFTGYAATLAGEGLARLLGAVAVAAVGVAGAGLFGMTFALGTLVGVAAGAVWLRSRPVVGGGVDGGVDDPGPERAESLALLVTAGLLVQAVANVAPILVTARLPGDAALALAFSSAFILVRVPLFVFSPVQALLLPGLTEAVTRGDLGAVRAVLRRISVWVLAVGVLGAAGSAVLGPWAVRVFFGAQAPLSPVLLGVLGVGTILLMVAQVLQPALIALGARTAITVSWAVGTAVLLVVLVLPGSPVVLAAVAQIAGPVLVVVGMAVVLVRRLTRVGALVDAVQPV